MSHIDHLAALPAADLDSCVGMASSIPWPASGATLSPCGSASDNWAERDDEDDEDDEDEERGEGEEDIEEEEATMRNYFVHNGLRYDGDFFELRPPSERTASTLPTRVLEHTPGLLTHRQAFNRVYSEATFSMRPASLVRQRMSVLSFADDDSLCESDPDRRSKRLSIVVDDFADFMRATPAAEQHILNMPVSPSPPTEAVAEPPSTLALPSSPADSTPPAASTAHILKKRSRMNTSAPQQPSTSAFGENAQPALPQMAPRSSAGAAILNPVSASPRRRPMRSRPSANVPPAQVGDLQPMEARCDTSSLVRTGASPRRGEGRPFGSDGECYRANWGNDEAENVEPANVGDTDAKDPNQARVRASKHSGLKKHTPVWRKMSFRWLQPLGNS
jgi:hypothetical protein